MPAQIAHEFERFSTRLRGAKIANFFGGIPITQNRETLKKDLPNIVIGTPGRIKQVRGFASCVSRAEREPQLDHILAAPTRCSHSTSLKALTGSLTLLPASDLQLAIEKALKLSTVHHFVLDECDKMLEKLGECSRSTSCQM